MKIAVASGPNGIHLAMPAEHGTRDYVLSVETARELGWALIDAVETTREGATGTPALEGPMLRTNPSQIGVLIAEDHMTLSVAFNDWRPWQIELSDERARQLVQTIQKVLAMPIAARAQTAPN